MTPLSARTCRDAIPNMHQGCSGPLLARAIVEVVQYFGYGRLLWPSAILWTPARPVRRELLIGKDRPSPTTLVFSGLARGTGSQSGGATMVTDAFLGLGVDWARIVLGRDVYLLCR